MGRRRNSLDQWSTLHEFPENFEGCPGRRTETKSTDVIGVEIRTLRHNARLDESCRCHLFLLATLLLLGSQLWESPVGLVLSFWHVLRFVFVSEFGLAKPWVGATIFCYLLVCQAISSAELTLLNSSVKLFQGGLVELMDCELRCCSPFESAHIPCFWAWYYLVPVHFARDFLRFFHRFHVYGVTGQDRILPSCLTWKLDL